MKDTNNLYQIAKDISQRFFYVKSNIVTSKSLSFNYIRYRVLRPVLKLYFKSFRASYKYSPWTSPASIEIFKAILDKSMTGFEYGSGKSTLFFAQQLGQLTSVEHNEEWYKIVKDFLKDENAQNVEYRFCPQKKDISPETADGVKEFYNRHQLSEEKFEVRADYFDYFELINKYPDNHFNFILIDGRARVECALNAIPKLKTGGVFVLDNSERERYELVHERLQNWPSVNTTTGLTDTTLWFKP